MKKKIIIALIIVFIIISIFVLFDFLYDTRLLEKPGQPTSKELMCCENCLQYGVYEDSKNCLEVIKQNGGLRHCLLVLNQNPLTFSQCNQIINESK